MSIGWWTLLLWAPAAGAQVVRGTVRDARSGAPIPGVVITVALADTPASAGVTLSALSSENGTYSVNAGRPGRYVVSAKRVGMKRFGSEAFGLTQGETHPLDIALTPIDFAATLPVVSVTAETPCVTNEKQAGEVAALWEEARAALFASRLALRDRVFKAAIRGYTRMLSANSLRIQREETSLRRGVTEQPFRAPPPANLSSEGFVQRDPGGDNTFFGPDATTLTSAEFLRDHCFAISRDGKRRPGLVGLGFAPVKARRLPDVRGAFWMDSASRELRLVDFAYVNLPDAYDRADARGEVHFSLSPRGTWYVSRWFIRMPEFGRSDNTAGVPGGSRLEVKRYKEDGGEVIVEGQADTRRAATIAGRAMDSTGRRAMAGATVRLAGTERMATVRSDGSFVIDSIAPAAYTLVLEHPGYAQLGFLAAEQDLEVTSDGVTMTALEALKTSSLLRRLCSIDELKDDTGVLRVLVRDTADRPVDGHVVRLRYEIYEGTSANNMRRRPAAFEGPADEFGAVTFCDVPARIPLHLEADLEKPTPHRVDARLDPLTISVVTIKIGT